MPRRSRHPHGEGHESRRFPASAATALISGDQTWSRLQLPYRKIEHDPINKCHCKYTNVRKYERVDSRYIFLNFKRQALVESGQAFNVSPFSTDLRRALVPVRYAAMCVALGPDGVVVLERRLEDSGDESEGWKDQRDAEGGQQRNAFVPRALSVVG